MNNIDYYRALTSIFTDRFFRFLAFVVLFVALLFSQKNLILISILVLTMFYFLKIWGFFSIKNVHYSFSNEKTKGFPGEIVSIQGEVNNYKLLPIWLRLLIPLDQRLVPTMQLENNCLTNELILGWYDRLHWQWNFTAHHRGCFQIGPPFLETSDLLGFFPQRRYLSQSMAEIIIYPKPIVLNLIATPLKELFGKTNADHPVKDPIYPIATREYQHGEPSKFIHWKASAHYNRLHSKIFDSSTQRKTLLIIDVSTFQKNKQAELFEQTLEVVSALILEFEKRGSPYSIISNGKAVGDNVATNFSFGTGTEQLSKAMETLARLTIEESCPIEDLLFRQVGLPAGTGCIYGVSEINENNMLIDQFFKKRNIPVYFLLANPIEQKNINQIPCISLTEIHGGVVEVSETLNVKKL